MTEPLVVCVLLTKDRPAMAKRAVESFRSQTYANKRLLIVNSGHCGPITTDAEQSCEVGGITEPCFVGIDGWTIGALRNHACKYASHHYATSNTRPEIFAHLDDDDLSHSARLAEQVALLQASGADCVGYSDMLFGRIRQLTQRDVYGEGTNEPWDVTEEAWLFTAGTPNYVLGTSMMFWRKAWEQRPFLNESAGVEEKWCRDSGLKIVGVSSMGGPPTGLPMSRTRTSDRSLGPNMGYGIDPRMIASIHGGNSSPSYNIEEYVRLGSTQWKRAPEWDENVREKMKL